MRVEPKGEDLTEEPTAWQPCEGRPAVAIDSRDGTLLLLESGACFGLSRSRAASLERTEELDGFSSAVGQAEGGVVVGLYSCMIARWQEGRGCWFREVGSPVTALVETSLGVASGDTKGWITFLDLNENDPERTIPLDEPIVALIGDVDHLVALGSSGAVVRIEIAFPNASRVDHVPVPGDFGRVFGLFSHGGSHGFFGASRLARVDVGNGSLQVGEATIPGGIAEVVSVGVGLIAVRTDESALWFVDSGLRSATLVNLPGKPVGIRGMIADATGNLLVWTSSETLFAIDSERRIVRLPFDAVALAYRESGAMGRVSVLEWDVARGLRREFLKPRATR